MSKVTQPRHNPDTKHVCCRECANAILHRYGNDPLLAFCKLKPKNYGHLPFQVEVANAIWSCSNFKKRDGDSPVMQLFKVRSYSKACHVTSQTKCV